MTIVSPSDTTTVFSMLRVELEQLFIARHGHLTVARLLSRTGLD